jgi:hypothetical protein
MFAQLLPLLALLDPQNPIEPMSGAVRPDATVPVSLMDLARADVVLEAGAGNSPSTPGGGETPTGKVVDLVLSTQDGQVVCAALAVGKLLGSDERVILVPATAYKFATVEKRTGVVLRLTKAEISALPEFDIKKEGKDGLDRAVERARGLGAGGGASGIREGSAPKSIDGAPGPAYVLALQLPEVAVSGTDAEFGKVHDASVDPAKNTVGYIIVSRSGGAGSGPTMHAVPYRACKWLSTAGKTEVRIEKTSEQLKAAPEYKKPDQGILTAEQMKSADAFFGSGKSGTEGTRPL